MRRVAVALIVVACVSAACGTSVATPADGRVPVVTSTDVWGSVAAAVGGADVDVTAIIHNPSQDPHDYQSTPTDAARISTARLAVYNGDGYDDFFADDLAATPSAQRVTVVAYALSGQPPEGNEHVFYDLPTVRRVADTVATELSHIRPADASGFRRRAAAFDGRIDALLARAHQIGVRHPGQRVVVTEPVADYLLRAAGIQDATPTAFEHAVESDTDIPVAAINAMTDLITSRHLAAVVNNAQTVTNITSQLIATARSAGVPVVDVTETLAQGTNGYLTWMGAQIDALARAIGPAT